MISFRSRFNIIKQLEENWLSKRFVEEISFCSWCCSRTNDVYLYDSAPPIHLSLSKDDDVEIIVQKINLSIASLESRNYERRFENLHIQRSSSQSLNPCYFEFESEINRRHKLVSTDVKSFDMGLLNVNSPFISDKFQYNLQASASKQLDIAGEDEIKINQ